MQSFGEHKSQGVVDKFLRISTPGIQRSILLGPMGKNDADEWRDQIFFLSTDDEEYILKRARSYYQDNNLEVTVSGLPTTVLAAQRVLEVARGHYRDAQRPRNQRHWTGKGANGKEEREEICQVQCRLLAACGG